jgi:thymidylate synthase (FAD)
MLWKKESKMYTVLDKGFVNLIDHIGSDLTVVNSARVSFGKRKIELHLDDVRLIKYLAKHKHYSPFRHLIMQFHIKAPEFVTRQLYKHVVGIETTSGYATKDHAWNEKSLRYVVADEYYHPINWRYQAKDSKQGSGGIITERSGLDSIFNAGMKNAWHMYKTLVKRGVAKEQARLMLPLALYTEFYWTASFQAIMNFLELRLTDEAQWEIREYARVLLKYVYELYPETTNAWMEQ